MENARFGVEFGVVLEGLWKVIFRGVFCGPLSLLCDAVGGMSVPLVVSAASCDVGD